MTAARIFGQRAAHRPGFLWPFALFFFATGRPLRYHALVRVARAAPILALASCAQFRERLTYGEIESAAVEQRVQYAAYAPPHWNAGESLPLVIFLHGGGDGADCFDRHGVGQYLDEEIAAGRAPRTIIVVPQGDFGFWENWYDGSRRYRDWVMRELLPTIRDEYGTIPCPAGCHVMGISMGGHGALRFARLEHENLASVTSISGPVIDTQRMIELSESFFIGMFVPVERIWGPIVDRDRLARDDLFLAWQSQSDLRGVRLMLAWGTLDRGGLVASNEAFHRHLRERNIEHHTSVFVGGHEWNAWKPVIAEALRVQLGQGSSRKSSTSPPAGRE
jgi:enterochelin esterase-like enzyme